MLLFTKRSLPLNPMTPYELRALEISAFMLAIAPTLPLLTFTTFVGYNIFFPFLQPPPIMSLLHLLSFYVNSSRRKSVWAEQVIIMFHSNFFFSLSWQNYFGSDSLANARVSQWNWNTFRYANTDYIYAIFNVRIYEECVILPFLFKICCLIVRPKWGHNA